MLKENRLFIDRDCPMCGVYGNAFKKLEMIDRQTLCHYQAIDSAYAEKVDLERAKDEIALLDTSTGNTAYGIDAFIKIIGHNYPLLNRVLKLPIIHFLLLRLYRFVSYNRKVIYPSVSEEEGQDCTPSLNLKYRALYLIFTALFTGLVLNQFMFHVAQGFDLPHSWLREYVVCFGQVAWQFVAIQLINKKYTWDYLGNMSTVSLIGGILLLPILAFHTFIGLSPWVLLLGFGMVVGVIFFEHIRRCALLGISLKMTASWVLYRTVVLAIILAH